MKEGEKEIERLNREKEDAIKAGDFALAKEIQDKQNEARKSYETAKKRFENRCKSKNLSVTEESVAQIVSDWTKIPVQKLAEKETKRLSRLENILHKRSL